MKEATLYTKVWVDREAFVSQKRVNKIYVKDKKVNNPYYKIATSGYMCVCVKYEMRSFHDPTFNYQRKQNDFLTAKSRL